MSGSGSAAYGIFKEEPRNTERLFDGCYTYITKAAQRQFIIK